MTSVTINPTDGGADLAAAINAALADPDVTKVVLGEGLFVIHTPIFVPSGKSLVGAGRDLTVIRAAEDFDRPELGELNGVVNSELGGHDVTLSDFSVDANKLMPDGFRLVGVFMRQTTDFSITRVDVYNASGYGHFAQGDANDFTVYASGTYDDCAVFNAQIAFEQMACDGIVLTDCHARDGDGDIPAASYFHPLTGSRNISYVDCTGYGYANVGFEITPNVAKMENIRIVNSAIEILSNGSALVAGGTFAVENLEIINSTFVAQNYVGVLLYGVSGTADRSSFQGEAIGIIFFNGTDGRPSSFVATDSIALGLRDPIGGGAAYGIAGEGELFWQGGTIEARGSTHVGLMVPIGSQSLTYTADTQVVMSGYGATLNYTENAPAAAIAPTLVLVDPVWANLAGGLLTVAFQSKGTADDQLGILDQGLQPGQIGVSGSDVTFDGVVIGKVSGGANGDDLVVSLGAAATPLAVQALIRAISFANLSDMPARPSRAVEFVVTDATGSTSSANAAVVVAQINDLPLLASAGGGPNATLAYEENGAAAAIAPGATLSDVDSPDFAGGSLRVELAGGTGADRLTLLDRGSGAGQIGVAGGIVTYGGVEIGVLAGGADGATPLVVALHAGATPAAVEALIRAVAYDNVSDDPAAGPRTVLFTVEDGAGGPGVSTGATISLTTADDEPMAQATAAAAAENGLVTFGPAILDPDGGPAAALAEIEGRSVSASDIVTLASGATVTLNADGTLSYDPNGAFDSLADSGSGAANAFAADSFSYALANGTSATVTVTISGVASPGDQLRGSAADDDIAGSGGGDLFRLEAGGADVASGGGGNDAFLLGASLDAGDSVDGGDGKDQLGLQGDYAAGLALGAGNLVNIETLALFSGTDARFGDPGGSLYSYYLISVDENVSAGQTLTINFNGLQVGEDVIFDGSAETDGSFFFYGGQGDDTLIGGAGADAFLFGQGASPLFTAAERIDGGGGRDQLGLRGSYSLVLEDETFVNVESLALISGDNSRFGSGGADFHYEIETANGNVAAGQQLSVNGAGLRSTESMTFDGSAELDGSFRILAGRGDDTLAGGAQADFLYGGQGKDVMDGGAGADTFFYRTAAESAPESFDVIRGFEQGDRIDLAAIDADAATAGSNEAFISIGSEAFSRRPGELRFETVGADTLIEGDVDGDGQADFSILVENYAISTPDILF